MKIFLNEPIDKQAYQLLKEKHTIINNKEDIISCDVIITRNMKVNQSLIDQCPLLKLIVVHGTGYDDVDVEYAKAKGIEVRNTPGENAQSVAEMNVALMLSLSRKIHLLHQRNINRLVDSVAPKEYEGVELFHKTVGFIGVGDIAIKTADILHHGFHMNCIGYSPSFHKNKKRGVITSTDIESLLKESDYVCVCCSLNNDTYHMINKDYFDLMKEDAYLINCARGAIINEDDLYDALLNHSIKGAGLDVLEGEPHKEHPLYSLQNVVYTSHMGATTKEALYNVGMKVVEIINTLH